MSLTHDDVAEIIRLIETSRLDEMVIEVGDVRIQARRRGVSMSAHTPLPRRERDTPRVTPAPVQPVEAATGSPPASSSHAPSSELGQAVKAPMVGTFYRRPSPDAAPFVEVGSRVEADEPLCLVEVMKLYTTITAPHAGIITWIGAEDSTLVEYNQVLFMIEPA